MKSSAKDIAIATLEVAEKEGSKTAAKGVFNYLKKRNQIKMLPKVLVELSKAEEAAGRVVARVSSASALSVDQKHNIISKIKKISQAKEVAIEEYIDKSLIGGIKISFEDKIIDQTIKSRINKLKAKLMIG